MKMYFINRILLLVEIVPVIFLLFWALIILGSDTRPIFLSILILSILSLVSLIYIIIMTVFNKANNIKKRFIYLAHIGVLITIVGLLSILAGSNFKDYSPDAPFAIFSFGLIGFIPYLHVMLINRFFI